MLTDDDCENLIEGTERRLKWWLQNRMPQLKVAFRKHDSDVNIWMEEVRRIEVPSYQIINDDEATLLLDYLDTNYRFQCIALYG